MKAPTQVLKSGRFPPALNYTFITLIPKKNQVMKVLDFRPISLCNILYKLIAKVIANRLKVIIHNIILDSQNVFVPETQISDNIFIAYELLYLLRWKKKGK